MTLSDERLRDMLRAMQECAERPENSGHGHVFKRPDGSRARCGGPGLCAECSKDQDLKHRALPGFEVTFSLVNELLSRRASPHGEAGVTDAMRAAAIDAGMQTARKLTALGTSSDYTAMACAQDAIRKLEAALSASPATVEPVEVTVRRMRDEEWPDRQAASPGSSAGAEPLGDAGKAALEDDLIAMLRDPNAVHQNMLRGTIAKPSVEQIVHLYGDALASAPPEREGLEEASVVVNALGRAADFLLGVSTQTGTTSEYRDKALAARFAVISAIRALTGKGGE